MAKTKKKNRRRESETLDGVIPVYYNDTYDTSEAPDTLIEILGEFARCAQFSR